MQTEKEIGRVIEKIANKRYGGLRFPVMSGVVKAVHDDMTADVELSVDDAGVVTTEVMQSVVLNNMAGLYGKPTIGAYCIVAEVDGPGKWELLKASAYDEVVLRGDALGGLPILQKVQDNLDTLKNYIKNKLEPAIGDAFTAVGAGSSANGAAGKTSFVSATGTAAINFEDMENKKVKQA
jgi:hypothetical protein